MGRIARAACYAMRMRPRTALLAALALTLAAAGCGGDPLVGTWTTHDYPGGSLPAGVASYEEDLTFSADQSLTVSFHLGVSKGAAMYGGCTETCELSGLRWANADQNGTLELVISGTATRTASRSGCASPDDDEASEPATGADCLEGMPGGELMYVIANGVLTTMGAGGSTASYTLVGG